MRESVVTDSAFGSLRSLIIDIDRKVSRVLALVQIDQATLDSYGTALADIATALAAEIDALKNAVPSLPAANVAAIDAQVAALKALETPAPSA